VPESQDVLPPASNHAAATPHALIIGWDGARYDLLDQLGLPVLEAIKRAGFVRQTWMPDVNQAKTVTAPGWTTNLTGVWPAKHGITDNQPRPHHLDSYPHLLRRYLHQRPEGKTLACLGSSMLGSTKGPGPILAGGVSSMIFHDFRTDPMGPIGRDPEVFDDAARRLSAGNYDVAFVYFATTDKTAHLYGTGSEYRKALEQLDAWTGELIESVRRRPSFAREDWLLAIATDHGHRDEGGHGEGSWQERQSFIGMARLAGRLGFRPTDDLSAVDLAPTVLAHLGVPPEPAWNLDGCPLNSERIQQC
jgi:predicted AlkP superfamily pyrophosphatase or phosphodiesterase